jgi:hypothetical protein
MNYWVALAGTLLALVLDIAVTRGERIVSWDAFQYISLSRELAGRIPHHLGSHYPWGYPLLASPFVAAGLNPYGVLAGISLTAFLLLLFAISFALAGNERTRALRTFVPVLGAIPMMFVFASDAMSESLFTLATFLTIFLLTEWKKPRAIYLTTAAIVLAFTVRYAGIFLLVAALVWLLRDRFTSRSIPIQHAIGGISLAAIFIAVLLLSNASETGYLTGDPMVPGNPSFAGFLRNVANFGLGGVGTVSATLYVWLLRANSDLATAVGLLCMASLIALAVAALRFGTHLTAASGLAVLSYATTIILLQSVTTFADPDRYFLPLVPLLFVIVLDLFAHWPRTLIAAAALVFFVAGHDAAREPETEFSKDLTASADFLRPRLNPKMRVLINIDALSLASRLNSAIWLGYPGYNTGVGYVFMIDPVRFSPQPGDYLVIAATQVAAPNNGAQFETYWLQYLNARVHGGAAKILLTKPNLVVARFTR